MLRSVSSATPANIHIHCCQLFSSYVNLSYSAELLLWICAVNKMKQSCFVQRTNLIPLRVKRNSCVQQLVGRRWRKSRKDSPDSTQSMSFKISLASFLETKKELLGTKTSWNVFFHCFIYEAKLYLKITSQELIDFLKINFWHISDVPI